MPSVLIILELREWNNDLADFKTNGEVIKALNDAVEKGHLLLVKGSSLVAVSRWNLFARLIYWCKNYSADKLHIFIERIIK